MQTLLFIYMAFIIAGYFILLFPIVLLSLLLPFKARLSWVSSPIWKGFGTLTTRLLFQAPISVIDKRSPQMKEQTPFIKALYIANHQSFLDIPLLLTQVQIPPLMKKGVLYMPIIGVYGLAAGAIPVNKKSSSSKKNALLSLFKRMASGTCVQYYPEGRRNESGSPLPFEKIKTPLMKYAYEHQIPIIPISMSNTHKALNMKSEINLKTPLGVYLGKEVDPKDFHSEEEFLRYCWKQVEENHKKLV